MNTGVCGDFGVNGELALRRPWLRAEGKALRKGFSCNELLISSMR